MDQFEKRFVEMFCEQWNSDIGWPTGGSKGIDPWGSKFFQFHAVFGKIWRNRMLVPPLEGWRPTSGKSWIRHWVDLMYFPVLMKFINKKNFLFRALAWLKSPNFRKSSKDSYLIWEMSVYCYLIAFRIDISNLVLVLTNFNWQHKAYWICQLSSLVADRRGTYRRPRWSIFLWFHVVFQKCWQNVSKDWYSLTAIDVILIDVKLACNEIICYQQFLSLGSNQSFKSKLLSVFIHQVEHYFWQCFSL